ncbi:MAG: CpsD/CapB family tyrosine-protein kinase, partial [Aeoliella sp.]
VYDSCLVNAVAPESIDAQTIRIVRTALMFASNDDDAGQAIQFTSPTPSDGASLIAGNVAVALASAGKRVVLLDADLRRPSLDKLLGVQAGTGLAELLDDKANLPDVLCATGIENLELLPSGSCPTNPAELLSMPRFVELLDTLRDQFDFVIVDTPPLLAVSDPLSVAQHVNGVVLVVPIKPDSIPAAEHSVRLLDRFEAKVIGTVVNDLEDRWANSGNRLAYRYAQAHASYAEAQPVGEELAATGTNGQTR